MIRDFLEPEARPGRAPGPGWAAAAAVAIAAMAIAGGLSLAAGCSTAPPPDAETGARLVRLEARIDRIEAQLQELISALETPAAPPAGPARRVEGIEIGASPAIGPEDAPVTIVEFADFECPFSAAAAPTIESLLAAYPDQVRLVFKHYPMPFHKQAIPAHRAAAAAAGAGKFWEMYRLLFAHQHELDPASLREHARSLGLDLEVFDAGVASEETLEEILADRDLARKLGVIGVPAFFINGRLIAGPQPLDAFRKVVDEELALRRGER